MFHLSPPLNLPNVVCFCTNSNNLCIIFQETSLAKIELHCILNLFIGMKTCSIKANIKYSRVVVTDNNEIWK